MVARFARPELSTGKEPIARSIRASEGSIIRNRHSAARPTRQVDRLGPRWPPQGTAGDDLFGTSSENSASRIADAIFFSHPEGVKVIPANNPSGVMKRLTVWPHGSFVLYEHTMPLRFKVLSRLFDIVNVKLKPSLWRRK